MWIDRRGVWWGVLAEQACTAPPASLGFSFEVVSDELFMSPDQRAVAGLAYFPDGAGSILRDEAGYTLFLPNGGAPDDPLQGTHRFTAPSLDTFEALVPSSEAAVLTSGTNAPGPDDFDRDYAGGGSVIRRPDALHAFYYGEFHWDAAVPLNFYGSNGYAVSTDGGLTWQKRGEIVRVRLPREAEQVVGSVISAVVREDHVHLYYQDHDPDGVIKRPSIAVARVALADLDGGGDLTVEKYHEGDFSQPGMSGRFTPIAQDWRAPQSQGTATVLHNAALDLDVMVHVVYEADGAWTLAMRSSTDGLTWSAPETVGHGTPENRFGYPMLVGLDEDPSVLGGSFHLYYVDRFGDWSQARWRRMEISVW